MKKVKLTYLAKVAEELKAAGNALHINPRAPGVHPRDFADAAKALQRAASALASATVELEDTLNQED